MLSVCAFIKLWISFIIESAFIQDQCVSVSVDEYTHTHTHTLTKRSHMNANVCIIINTVGFIGCVCVLVPHISGNMRHVLQVNLFIVLIAIKSLIKMTNSLSQLHICLADIRFIFSFKPTQNRPRIGAYKPFKDPVQC